LIVAVDKQRFHPSRPLHGAAFDPGFIRSPELR
jgi:hypothetical protein